MLVTTTIHYKDHSSIMTSNRILNVRNPYVFLKRPLVIRTLFGGTKRVVITSVDLSLNQDGGIPKTSSLSILNQNVVESTGQLSITTYSSNKWIGIENKGDQSSLINSNFIDLGIPFALLMLGIKGFPLKSPIEQLVTITKKGTKSPLIKGLLFATPRLGISQHHLNLSFLAKVKTKQKTYCVFCAIVSYEKRKNLRIVCCSVKNLDKQEDNCVFRGIKRIMNYEGKNECKKCADYIYIQELCGEDEFENYQAAQ